jgi:hypothetical protein
MPKNVARADGRFKQAVGYLKKYTNMTLPDAMKLDDFSVQEQACHAKCMVLHRLWKKQKGVKNDSHTTPPPCPVVVVNIFEKGTPSSVTDESANEQASSLVSQQEHPMPKIQRIRLPVKAAQVRRAEAAKKKRELHTAFKRATIIYDRERQKPDGMSAQSVVDLIKNETGVELSRRTIQQKVNDGNVGTSPLRRGPKVYIPKRQHRNLCIAYKSFVTINQLNGQLRVCRPKRDGPLVNKVIYGTINEDDWVTLFNRVQNDTAIKLRRQKAKSAEDRRIRWTTHNNISMWFENWENDLVQLGLQLVMTLGRFKSPLSSSTELGISMRHACLLTAATQSKGAVQILTYTILNSLWLELQCQRVH